MTWQNYYKSGIPTWTQVLEKAEKKCGNINRFYYQLWTHAHYPKVIFSVDTIIIIFVFEFIVSCKQITYGVLLHLNLPNLERVQINNKIMSDLELWGFYTNITKPLMFYLMTSLCDLWPCLKNSCKCVFGLQRRTLISCCQKNLTESQLFLCYYSVNSSYFHCYYHFYCSWRYESLWN